jgi:DNA primase
LPGPFKSLKEKADLVRNINLVAVLEQTSCVRDTCDKAKWHTPKGTISVSGHKFINWSMGVGGGGAIDLVMHLEGFDFKTAVLWLAHLQIDSNEMKPSTKAPLQLPIKDKAKLSHLIHYLVHTRSIPHSLTKSLIDSGKLYADPKGNAVFLLLGKEKMVVGAELRGTNLTRWHGMAKGSRKDLGFFGVQNHHPHKAVLCESAIDAISFLSLYPTCLVISTSGAHPNPVWLTSLIDSGYDIYCGFDADKTGDTLAQKMISLHPSIKRLRPPTHDWNDLLRSKSKTNPYPF